MRVDLDEFVTDDVLRRSWSLDYEGLECVWSKRAGTRLVVALRLKRYLSEGQFPDLGTLQQDVLEHVASQIDPKESSGLPTFEARTQQRYRRDILTYVGITPFGLQDDRDLTEWLSMKHGASTSSAEEVERDVRLWCLARRVEPPMTKTARRKISRARTGLICSGLPPR